MNAVAKALSKGRRDRANVGKTPGATRSVNIYSFVDADLINFNEMVNSAQISFADLPGYGYAKLSKTLKNLVSDVAESYLAERKELAVVCFLVDLRRDITEEEREILDWLEECGRAVVIVGTKSDKLTSAERERQVSLIEEDLGIEKGQLLAVSSETGEGVSRLWNVLEGGCGDFLESQNDRP